MELQLGIREFFRILIPGEATKDRLRSTLEALSLLAGARPPEANGRLSRELEPPGFEVVAPSGGVAPATRPGSERTAETTFSAPGAAGAAGADDLGARAELALAEAELGLKSRVAEMARAALAEAEHRAGGAQAELVEAERRLERARQRVREAAAAVDGARAQAAAAAAAQAEAERALDAARRRLASAGA